MAEIMPLAALGRRIVICGPSNSGKSTLARALGRRLELPVVYLDLLRHEPGTNWVPRPAEDFVRRHAAAIAEDGWVMEGNYFSRVPERLARATGIIFLGSEPWRGLGRYVRRTLFETRHRAGQLEGGVDRLNLQMVRWILFTQPSKHARDRDILAASGLPMLELGSMRQLNDAYEAWGLTR